MVSDLTQKKYLNSQNNLSKTTGIESTHIGMAKSLVPDHVEESFTVSTTQIGHLWDITQSISKQVGLRFTWVTRLMWIEFALGVWLVSTVTLAALLSLRIALRVCERWEMRCKTCTWSIWRVLRRIRSTGHVKPISPNAVLEKMEIKDRYVITQFRF